MDNAKPRFTHDCDECKFLSQYREYDLYMSTTCNGGIKTVVARWSDEGPSYISGWDVENPILQIAQAMAEYEEME